jgi:hypothetical protein
MTLARAATIFDGTWQGKPRDTDSSGGGCVAARDRSTTDREGEAMGTRKRTAGRFQVEALETRWTPGGLAGGVFPSVAACHIGEEIPQVHVAPALYGSNSIRAGQEGNATSVADGSKPGIASGSN